MDSEFPVVEGKLSFGCCLGAIENCYECFQQKFTLCKKKMVNNGWLENNQVVVGINEELGMKIKSSSNICYDLLII
ncbi:hydroxymethylglutaryl-coa synthase a [Anaeramoeba flamelloides]|uniref:Hydroxymethylglutaryl-coa synthase a n=1 Tax=Anaeramoeba flamelloides TaxID=1746091 RepID=A0ABQ8XPK8_9EUKA|nr:hydroxymethylglutaryl-coa synthase a [Anaeramoeba flamelloides]